MRIGSLIVAILLFAGPVSADPQKSNAQEQQANRPAAPLILAAADAPRTPSADSTQPNPVPKRSHGRVTKCRCGDPQPETPNTDQ